MHIELTVEEAVALARAARPLPPLVLAVRPSATGDGVEADVDPTQVPGSSGLMRFVSGLAGVVTVTARLVAFADGDAVVELAAQARGLTVDRMLNLLLGQLRSALADQGLPPDLVELRAGDDGPLLVAHVQRAVDERVAGVVVEDVGLRDGVVRVRVGVGPDAALR